MCLKSRSDVADDVSVRGRHVHQQGSLASKGASGSWVFYDLSLLAKRYAQTNCFCLYRVAMLWVEQALMSTMFDIKIHVK
jgi:hypothetical protein